MGLEDFGWAPVWEQQLARTIERIGSRSLAHYEPGRVVFSSREHFRVQCVGGAVTARCIGRLLAGGVADWPVVGDWVVVERSAAGETGRIHSVLPRKSCLSRKVAGTRTQEQVVAANVDTIFLVMGLDGDFNRRRLERLLVMAWESGADPVVVLTKADLCQEVGERRHSVEQIAAGVPLFVTSSHEGRGLEPLAFYLTLGRTVAMIGSSGAGKSTLLNRLAAEEWMRTGTVREGDDRGRHTTTHRQLFLLPGGGLLIDNPGIREIQLWTDEASGLGHVFEDIETLAERCRYRDCRHQDEPGCAVLLAVEDGRLEGERLENLRRLEREQRYLELRQDEVSRRQQERKQGAFYKSVQKAKRNRRRS